MVMGFVVDYWGVIFLGLVEWRFAGGFEKNRVQDVVFLW
jgi:hypothetical protein